MSSEKYVEKTLERFLPGPTGKAIISALAAISLIVVLFWQVSRGNYGAAVVSGFFAIVNVDAGRVQWAKRREVAA